MDWRLPRSTAPFLDADANVVLAPYAPGHFAHVALPLSALDGVAVLEPPCDLKFGFNCIGRLRVGAFTYSFSHIPPGVAEIGRYCSIADGVVFGAAEHPTSWLSTSSFAYQPDYMTLFMPGMRSRFAPVALEAASTERIEIGNDVWIGQGAYIRSGVRLGDGCVVGTRALVTRDVPPYAVVAGNPARVIKSRFPEPLITRLRELAWWRFHFHDFAGLDPRDPEAAIPHVERLMAEGMEPYRPEVFRLTGDGVSLQSATREPFDSYPPFAAAGP